MNEAALQTLQIQFGIAPHASADVNRYLAAHTNKLFNDAAWAGLVRRLWATITRKSDRLLDLTDEIPTHVSGDGHYVGIRAVKLSDIRGSENRSYDFNADFAPIQQHSKDRWKSVMMARLRGIPLPPVQLVQVGDIYFVRDGHHRISVAHALGECAIDAEVTVWRAPRSVVRIPTSWQVAGTA
jgi:hypothetical protein